MSYLQRLEHQRTRAIHRINGYTTYLLVKHDRLSKAYPAAQDWEYLGPPTSQPLSGPSSQPITLQEPPNTYQYLPLTDPNSLRLLKALPSTRNDYVEIEIWEVQKPTPYRCLSYTWGDQSCQFSILLNGRRALVGANLLSFLKMAAQRYPGQAFWIDALCINQFDDDEKSVQVQRMGSIYENAEDVLIWLGHHEGIAALFEWADKPRSTIGDAIAHVPIEKTPRHLRSYILDLAKHPYWRRAWVAQEMMLARAIWIACGSITVSPNALLRCHKSIFMSRSMDESMVHHNLKSRLNGLCSTRSIPFPQQFWYVFKLSGELLHCSNPRDRIYSILAVTGQDKLFAVDYTEDIVSFFWRSLHYFAPAADPAKVQRLWNSLELTPGAIEEAVKAKGGPLQFHVPMRRTEIKPDVRRQLPSLFRLRRTGLCGHDTVNFARAQIRGYCRHDILLCPGTTNSLDLEGMDGITIDLEGIHVLVHPLGSLEDRFAFTLLTTTYGRLPQFEGTELWSKVDGFETKIQKWSEVAQVADLGGFSNRDDHDWVSRPHFIVKLSHLYFLESLRFVQDFWESKAKRSWIQWPQAGKFVDNALVTIGFKNNKSLSKQVTT